MQSITSASLLTLFLFTVAGTVGSAVAQVGSTGGSSLGPQTRTAPTAVVAGQMSDRERAHSKLFSEAHNNGEDLDEKTRRGQDVLLVMTGSGQGIANPYPTPINGIVSRTTCDADAIVIGRVSKRTSQLTENKKWVFSDIGIQVLQVLKGNPASPIHPSSELIVTESGGSILLNGHRVDVVEPGGILREGQSYLLFLRHLAGSGDYTLAPVNDNVLLVQNGKLSSPPGVSETTFNGMSVSRMISLVDSASAECAASAGGTK